MNKKIINTSLILKNNHVSQYSIPKSIKCAMSPKSISYTSNQPMIHQGDDDNMMTATLDEANHSSTDLISRKIIKSITNPNLQRLIR